jgi:hypothetical protein
MQQSQKQNKQMSIVKNQQKKRLDYTLSAHESLPNSMSHIFHLLML